MIINIDIINRNGTLYTRGESFHENEMYTHTDRWKELDEVDREDFIKRTDRGVFSVEAKRTIDQAKGIRLITGTVKHIEQDGPLVEVNVARRNQIKKYQYDKVIVAIGFDPLWPFDLLSQELRPGFPTENRTKRWQLTKPIMRLIDECFRVPLPFNLDSNNGYRNFHVPMLSALSQGPGFPNLSCLGSLSDRVLTTYCE